MRRDDIPPKDTQPESNSEETSDKLKHFIELPTCNLQKFQSCQSQGKTEELFWIEGD